MGPFYQPHGIILSYGYIPVNYIKRFYRLFVWIWRLYCGDLLSGRNTYIPSQTDSSLCIPPCTSIGMFCLRFTPVIAVLLQRFAFGSRLSLQFCCNVLPSVHACCLTLSAKQDGLRYLAFLFRAGRDRHSCVLAALFGYLPLWVHFGFGCFFMAISTGLRPESAIRKGTPFSCNVPFAINL